MEDKLKQRESRIGGRHELGAATEEIARDGTRFREGLTKGASFDTPGSLENLPGTLEILSEGYDSVDNLKRWINAKKTYVLHLDSEFEGL